MKLSLTTLLLSLLPLPGLAESTFVIENGDVEALSTALCQANVADEPVRVILAVDGFYEFPGRGPRVSVFPGDQKMGPFGSCLRRGGLALGEPYQLDRKLFLNGRGSELRGIGFEIREQAEVTLADVDINLTGTPQIRAIENRGRTRLERVSISGVRAEFEAAPGVNSATLPGLGIYNSGRLEAVNVSLFNLIADFKPGTFPQEPFSFCLAGGMALYNTGAAQLRHVTFGMQFVARDLSECLVTSIFNAPEGQVVVGQSIVSGQVNAACAGDIQSSGDNVFSAPECVAELVSNDAVDAATAFVLPPITSGYRRVVPLTPDHPARGRVAAQNCVSLDQRGHPRLINASRCDAGAVETNSPPPASVGVVTGLWFEPDRDGAYLQVSYVRPSEVLVTWQTFDRDGNNLWLYGLGSPQGNEISLELFRNRGPFTNAGRLEGSVTANRVGQGTITTISCDELAFEFELVIPELEAGDQLLSRLAFSEALGCDDGAF